MGSRGLFTPVTLKRSPSPKMLSDHGPMKSSPATAKAPSPATNRTPTNAAVATCLSDDTERHRWLGLMRDALTEQICRIAIAFSGDAVPHASVCGERPFASIDGGIHGIVGAHTGSAVLTRLIPAWADIVDHIKKRDLCIVRKTIELEIDSLELDAVGFDVVV